MDVEDVQGNEVNISGITEHYVAEEPGGQRIKHHFYVAEKWKGKIS